MKADFIYPKHTITTEIEIVETKGYEHEVIDYVVDHHPILNKLRRIFNKPVMGQDTIQIPGKLIPPVLRLKVDYDMQRVLTQTIQNYRNANYKFDIHIKNEVYVGCFPQSIEYTGLIDFAVDISMTKGKYDIYKWGQG